MATRWRMVRLPEDLASRLDRLAAETERAHREGRIVLASEHADRVPLWLVVERLADEVESAVRGAGAPVIGSNPSDMLRWSGPEACG